MPLASVREKAYVKVMKTKRQFITTPRSIKEASSVELIRQMELKLGLKKSKLERCWSKVHICN